MRKQLKMMVSLVLTMVLVVALATPAMLANASGAAVPTGTIKINKSTSVPLTGKTFYAYQILEATIAEGGVIDGKGINYKVPSDLVTFYVNYFKGLEGEYHVDLDANASDFDTQVINAIAALDKDKVGDAAAMENFVAAAMDYIETNRLESELQKGFNGPVRGNPDSVSIEDVPYGYYIVKDNGPNGSVPASALMLDSTTPNMDITLKASQPTIDKKIDAANDSDKNNGNNPVDSNNEAVGDIVPYIVTAPIPDMRGYVEYQFVMTDTLSKGLTLDFSDFKATFEETGKEPVTLVRTALNSDGTVSDGKNGNKMTYAVTKEEKENGTTVVTIVFNDFIQYKGKEGNIVVKYHATLNDNAVIGVAGNPNTVNLTYSNNPNTDKTGLPDMPKEGDPTGKTPESIVKTYVTGIELNKVDEEENRLTGAEFEITGERVNQVIVEKEVFTKADDGTYWKLKNGTYTTEAPSDTTKAQYASETDKYTVKVEKETIKKIEGVKAVGTVGTDGVLYFDGLAAGNYTITEIKSPDGYNILQHPIELTISCKLPAKIESVNDTCTWTYKAIMNGTDLTGVTNTKGTFVYTIKNYKGTELPETGGIGTTIFYVVGAILVVGAGIVLVTRRRMRAE